MAMDGGRASARSSGMRDVPSTVLVMRATDVMRNRATVDHGGRGPPHTSASQVAAAAAAAAAADAPTSASRAPSVPSEVVSGGALLLTAATAKADAEADSDAARLRRRPAMEAAGQRLDMAAGMLRAGGGGHAPPPVAATLTNGDAVAAFQDAAWSALFVSALDNVRERVGDIDRREGTHAAAERLKAAAKTLGALCMRERSLRTSHLVGQELALQVTSKALLEDLASIERMRISRGMSSILGGGDAGLWGGGATITKERLREARGVLSGLASTAATRAHVHIQATDDTYATIERNMRAAAGFLKRSIAAMSASVDELDASSAAVRSRLGARAAAIPRAVLGHDAPSAAVSAAAAAPPPPTVPDAHTRDVLAQRQKVDRMQAQLSQLMTKHLDIIQRKADVIARTEDCDSLEEMERADVLLRAIDVEFDSMTDDVQRARRACEEAEDHLRRMLGEDSAQPLYGGGDGGGGAGAGVGADADAALSAMGATAGPTIEPVADAIASRQATLDALGARLEFEVRQGRTFITEQTAAQMRAERDRRTRASTSAIRAVQADKLGKLRSTRVLLNTQLDRARAMGLRDAADIIINAAACRVTDHTLRRTHAHLAFVDSLCVDLGVYAPPSSPSGALASATATATAAAAAGAARR